MLSVLSTAARPFASKAATYILAAPREAARDIRRKGTRDHIVQPYGGLCLFTAL
ncbi:hypothetical protein ACVWW6_000502 [Bradyrhizobium sp. USDA 3311]|uniref:hypothetical protein n=1 Tax=Bradyrhizobium sp. LCT2 TaxID=2493093 RepID=UPI00192A28E5|nr:hypothetical protein [Bradyrhizobium sp. LCT2]